MNGPMKPRTLIAVSATGLILLLLLGGVVLAVVEKTSYLEGVWLSFCVISTTGFGDGPRTSRGMVLSMILFAVAAAHWFGILFAAFELGLRRAEAGRMAPNAPLRNGARWLRRDLR